MINYFADEVTAVTAEVCEMLISKNKSYGNSALDPVRIFSKATTDEQIRVRIDDKLSRLARGAEYGGEDTILDLIGYLVLLIVSKRRSEK